MTNTKKQRAHEEERLARHKRSRERFDELLLTKYISFSNDTKWLKIFSVLSDIYGREASPFLKLVEEEEYEYPNLFGEVFLPSWIDGCVGAFSYREIEWLRVPYHPALKFEFEVCLERENGFVKIYGYRKHEA